MPSRPECAPPPPPLPGTVEEAQTALAEVAHRLGALVDTLGAVHAGLPVPPDIEDRQEHRKPYDRATEVLATIESVLHDHLRPAIDALRRSARATDAELAEEYREERRRNLGSPMAAVYET